MRLRDLAPKNGTNLQDLGKMMDGRGWRAALPASMPDDMLLHLAHDFRSVESSCSGDAPAKEEVSSLASVLYVVTNLLIQHPARDGDTTAIDLPEASMAHAIQIYQWGVERELITRMLGLGSADQTASLLEGLWRTLHEVGER